MGDKKRQIKKEKIVDSLKSANYSVIDWYMDNSNVVYAFLVRNDMNNIDFICYIPANILLTVDSGSYLTEQESPDFDAAIGLWKDLPLESYAIIVHNGVLFKIDNEEPIEKYSISKEKHGGTEIDEFTADFDGLDESNIKVVASEGTSPNVKVVGGQNPFDIILDGGDYKAADGVNSKIEDCQPSILVNYKGFTYGQVIPLVNVVTFMNNLSGFEIKMANWNREILNYQKIKIKTSADEAVALLTTFNDSLKKSIQDWEDHCKTCFELLSKIQNMLEFTKNTKTVGEISKKANIALNQTNEQFIQRRDALIGLLTNCKQIFHQI